LHYLRYVSIAAALVSLTACSGSSSDSTGYSSSRPAAAPSAGTAADPLADQGPEDLHKQWGPDTMPDRLTNPQQFLYWRVDEMFRQADKDGDGRISTEEYEGPPENLQRMDTNKDSFLTKREVVTDATRLMKESGEMH
jgi:hypothetical protein